MRAVHSDLIFDIQTYSDWHEILRVDRGLRDKHFISWFDFIRVRLTRFLALTKFSTQLDFKLIAFTLGHLPTCLNKLS
jgi:hypothetical protein